MCYVKAINEVDLISCKMAHLATGNPCRPHRKPYFHKIAILTRTHSSRMRTIRCSRGVSPQGGGGSAWWGCLPHHHPPVNRMTDICENITFPQLRCGR